MFGLRPTLSLFARSALFLGLLASVSCVHTPERGLLLSDHALAGRIWDVKSRRFSDAAVLTDRLRSASIVLLGETHDNPEQHRIQARLYDMLTAGAKRRALAMEQFDVDRQAQIDAVLQTGGATPDRVAQAGHFDAGWNWAFYEPLVKLALAKGAPIVAANLSRAQARRVAASGFGVLGEARVARLRFDAVWSDARQAIMTKAISDGHCGRVGDDVLPGIVRAQRARDAVMAETLARYAGQGVVAIVGGGHARRDIGIPVYLAALAPDVPVVVVGLVEVEAGKDDPLAYLPAPATAATAGDAYDFVWFTPRAARRDPCQGLAAEPFKSFAPSPQGPR